MFYDNCNPTSMPETELSNNHLIISIPFKRHSAKVRKNVYLFPKPTGNQYTFPQSITKLNI